LRIERIRREQNAHDDRTKERIQMPHSFSKIPCLGEFHQSFTGSAIRTVTKPGKYL
jgi:hypothetical protein